MPTLRGLAQRVARLERLVTSIRRGSGVAVKWSAITGRPATYPPSTHTHPTSQVTGLDNTLASLQAQIDGGSTTKKIVPHQVTGILASDAFPIDVATTPQGSVRYPVRFAAHVTRFRVHVRNYSYGNAAGYTGTVSLTGLWWGEARYELNGDLDGGYLAAPTQINGAATINGTTEWVSGWVNVNAQPGYEWLLSLGWTTGAGAPTKIVSNWTRHWRTTNPSHASSTVPPVGVVENESGAPFDIWLECEVAATTPTVAFVGDSITVGNMHSKSFPVRYGQAHRIWPIVFAQFGGTLAQWATNDARWTRYGPVQVDSAVLLMGINDVDFGRSTNDLKFGLYDVHARIRQNLGARVMFSTLLPTNSSHTTGPKGTVRTEFNDWVMQRFPVGAAGTVDLAKAIAQPANPLLPVASYVDSGGIHLTAAGAVQVANAIPHLIGR